MKKLLLLLMVGCLISTGCTKKEIVLEQTEVTLHHGDTYQILAESPTAITYLSENQYHADVDNNGLVTANFVGETDIILQNANDEKRVHVKVEPTNFSVKDIGVKIGDSMSYVLEKFGEPLGEDLLMENYTMMVYSNTEYGMALGFVFDENDKVVLYLIGDNANMATEMKKYAEERYKYLGPYSSDGYPGDEYINALTLQEATMSVVCFMMDDLMAGIEFGTPEIIALMADDPVDVKNCFKKAIFR
ncbi:MAG: Ig-like domain-containing protein [Bacteroidales bacterium]|nr:Ig-like domain-containing protein [Bacteroidales bacterium]